MKLRSRTIYSAGAASHLRWAALPAEIRLMILEQAEIGNIKAHDLSNWARVSREWQTFFEPQIFQHLKLQFPGSDIDDLNSCVHGYRKDLVKKISLHVRTEEYDYVDKFDWPETRDTIKANNKVFSQALKKLFVSLYMVLWLAYSWHQIKLDRRLSERSKPPFGASHRHSEESI
ncbi:unnamed protein product [Colletotrichum noveboracense]|uniref:F-box domain-containing protein n=1 Tax=Colletotrichum noveboracense TaxID=2664923 RepID=A0A9W4WMQ6_9PEZI|nr:unnamed protein product [Colletotrichum noveboracense]